MGVQLAAEQEGFFEMENVNFTDSELVYHVRDALRAVPLGDTDNYNQLVGVLHHSERLAPDEVALLVTSLKALTGAVSYMNIVHHRSLLSCIFGMSLWNYGPDVMEALLELIISLAASSGQYVDSCLDMVVSNFMPPYSFLELLKQPRGLARKDQVLDHVHSALKDIADLVPLAPRRLEKIITDRLPNIYTKEPLIVIYVENMLRLASGVMRELVGSMMLTAVIDRLIDLDVEIPWDEIVHDDFSKGIFEMELEDLEVYADYVEKDGDELPREFITQRFREGSLIISDKLDSLMVLTLDHLKSCYDGGRLIEVFETLLRSFDKTVLTAYKSKFAQFVIFYACSLDPENCGKKFGSLLANIFMHDVYAERRMSAVAYLASYLSRAKFMSPSYVATVLESLVDWCSDYCKCQDGDINPKAHKVFYSGCQAIMYVLCFRMRSMLGVPRLKSQLILMGIEEILRHPLNPLQVCLPSIVEEFLRQANAANLFTVSDTFAFNGLLESEFSMAFGGIERLDMFFPFDPCLLKKSDRFIRPNFVYWSMVRTTYDHDEEDDDEVSSDEDDAGHYVYRNGLNTVGDETVRNLDEDDGMGRSFDYSDPGLDEFDYSLDKMSITPKNSLNYRFESRVQRQMQMPSRIRPSTSPESL